MSMQRKMTIYPRFQFLGLRFLFNAFLILSLSLLLAQKVVTANDEDKNPLLIFNGNLLDNQGNPVDGAQVQFWQTDHHGYYNHPQDGRNGVPLEPDFQYFGTATTAEDGSFQFRTYRPGIYSQRPITHIHYKVWIDGNDVFTSQFYFKDEGFTQYSELLQLDLVPHGDDDNSFVANKTVVLDLGLDGTLPLTPRQGQGPFYPAVEFFDLDSDLTNVVADEGTPTTTTKSPSSAPSPVLTDPTSSTTESPAIDPPTSNDADGGVDGASSSNRSDTAILFAMMTLLFLGRMDVF